MNSIKNETDLAVLQNYYHSVDIKQTYAAIEALSKIQSVDSTRELIHLYDDCLWRSIKIEVIKALAFHNNSRSIEFLIKLAKNDDDLPLSILAIESLGSIQNPTSLRFLEYLYTNGHKTKKTTVVLALTRLTSTSCHETFISDLKEALEQNEIQLAKNIIYSLGELKNHKSIPLLIDILEKKSINKDLKLSAVASLGKLSRDTAVLEKYSEQYKTDALDHQIFQQAINQINFRSHWKIEDYLQKLFSSDIYHKNLPLEFNAFSSEDVFTGIQLFQSKQNLPKILKVLSTLNHSDVYDWYIHFLKIDAVTDENILSASQSIAFHNSNEALKVIEYLANYDLDLAHESAVTSLTKADVFLKNFISSEKYKKSNDDLKIRTINRLVSFIQANPDLAKNNTQTAKFFENEIISETSIAVKNRWIRAAAQCELPQSKIFSIMEDLMTDSNSHKSILFYLENEPSHQSILFLKKHLVTFQKDNLIGLLKAMSAQEKNSFEKKESEGLLEGIFSKSKDEEILVQALRLLSKNKLNDYKKFIIEQTKSKSTLVILNAIIALKNYNDDDVPDAISAHLSSQCESIKGRAVDVLVHNGSMRSKRLLMDFLKDNLQHIEMAEKIIRSLADSKIKSEYFITATNDLIKNHPESEIRDSLTELKNTLENEFFTTQADLIPSEADIVEIDRTILQKLTHYAKYDPSVKASLRSAEMPFNKPELFNKFVDKSVCILGFTKAIDIFIEKQFGKKMLYPKLESRLHEFQNIIHLAKLHEDYVDSTALVKNLAIEKQFTAHSVPAHKMTLIAKGFLSAKLFHEQFKILDGLRAWGIMFLLFTRKTPLTPKPLIHLDLDDNSIAELSKKLMWLQDLRNPVAHRHTLTSLDDIKEIRDESYKILKLLEKLLIT